MSDRQVLRSPAAVPAGADLRPRRGGAGSLHDGRLGRGCFELLDPLVEALARYVIGGGKLHADDTPVPVLDPGRGKTKTGRLWTYVRDDRPAGEQEAAGGAVSLLARPQGRAPEGAPEALQRHPAGRRLRRLRPPLWERIQEAACWAHARRAFYDLHQANQSPGRRRGAGAHRRLYAIEPRFAAARRMSVAAMRQARAGPLLESLRDWLRQTLARCRRSPSSPRR